MQSSWRLREQKRKEEAEAAERRRAVEKNEISFPSLGTVGWGETLKTESEASQRWSAGDVVRTAPQRVSEASHSGGGAVKSSTPSLGIHARISAQVRRTQNTTNWRGADEYDYGDVGKESDDGWIEVSSRTKTKSVKKEVEPSIPSAEEYYSGEDDYDNMNS